MVEVFKTNINKVKTAKKMVKRLELSFPESAINFDLEDCDNILRIANCSVHAADVIQILHQQGFDCKPLD